MSRWVRVSADIFEHEFFAQSELTEREAWLWLIVKAAWKDTRHRVGSEMLTVPRGSLFVTLRELRDEWRWKSDFRVRSFLDLLARESMIERSANAGKTHITICNYDKYQSAPECSQRTESASATHGKRTENALKIPVYQDTKEDTSLRSVSCEVREGEKILIEAGANPETLKSWKLVRKAKKSGPITPEAARGIIREAGKAGIRVEAAILECCERGWVGFKASWMEDKRARAGPARQSKSDALFATLERMHHDEQSNGFPIPSSPLLGIRGPEQRESRIDGENVFSGC